MKEIVAPLLLWYDKNARVLPWREQPDPYRVWLSEIMLQQTRVEAVKDYYERFLQQLPTVQDLAEADEDLLLKLWQGLGYYNRARNLQKAAKVICDTYGGKFPTSYEQWLELPGIGAYTAGAVASIALGQRVPAVDGNVYRIYTRLHADATSINTPALQRKVRQEVLDILPEQAGTFNQALMDLGAMICVPNGRPHCEECPISAFCKARAQGNMQDYPVKPAKKQRKKEQKTVFVIDVQGKYLIRKRPEKGLLAGTWEFPSQEGMVSLEELQELAREWKLEGDIRLLGSAKHIFSHVEWHMLGYAISLAQVPDELQDWGIFCDKDQLERKYSIPSAYAYYMDQVQIAYKK